MSRDWRGGRLGTIKVNAPPFMKRWHAARLLCVSPDTLRGWFGRGVILGRKEKNGEVLISRESVEAIQHCAKKICRKFIGSDEYWRCIEENMKLETLDGRKVEIVRGIR